MTKPKWYQPFACDSWLRWRIAEYMNRKKHTCWDQLVTWVLYERRFLDLWDPNGNTGVNAIWHGCAKAAREDGACYCGKYQTGAYCDKNGGKPSVVVEEERHD